MLVRLLVVEDQPVIRSGLETLLAGTDISIAETASTAGEAIDRAATTKVDLVLLDVRLGEGDGLAALARIKAERQSLPVLVYTGYDNPAFAARAVALGAAGYLLKGTPREELISAIRRAATGETLWTRDELRRVTSAPGRAADVISTLKCHSRNAKWTCSRESSMATRTRKLPTTSRSATKR